MPGPIDIAKSTFDFAEDLRHEIVKVSSNMPFRISYRKDVDRMLLDYLTVRYKMISNVPRKVLTNPKLEEKLQRHPKKEIVRSICTHIENGNDINCFQSKRLFQAGFHDHLLYEWNVHHLHLSDQICKDGYFVKQTDLLLFIYIDDQVAVLLDMEGHKEGVFANVKWLEILEEHFPEVIAHYRDPRVLDFNPKVDSVERQDIWNSGLTMGGVMINGKYFRSPGIGRMLSGHSMIVVDTVTKIWRWLISISKDLENKHVYICRHYGLNSKQMKFKLRIGEETIEIFDNSTNTVILTYPYIFNLE